MTDYEDKQTQPVLVTRHPHMMSIVLNRPKALHSLNPQMIGLIREALEEALDDKRFQFVLLYARGGKGFCAGGDIKELARAVREKRIAEALHFLRQEYELDLFIHDFSKTLRGYPEYLGLTGQEMQGGECVRIGMATDLVSSSNLSSVIQVLEDPYKSSSFHPEPS